MKVKRCWRRVVCNVEKLGLRQTAMSFILSWLSLCGRKRWWLLQLWILGTPQHGAEENPGSKVAVTVGGRGRKIIVKVILGCGSEFKVSLGYGGDPVSRRKGRRGREEGKERMRILWASHDSGFCVSSWHSKAGAGLKVKDSVGYRETLSQKQQTLKQTKNLSRQVWEQTFPKLLPC